MKQTILMTIAILTLLISPAILTAQQSQYFTGTGGQGMSMTILRPQGQNLTREQDYLPDVIHGVMVSTISKYSAIDVMDRQSVERVITDNMNQAIYKDDNFDVLWVGQITQRRYVMSGKIIRTSTGFSLQFTITDNNTARTIATHSGTYTLSELEDQRAAHKAARDLLGQLGVQLTQTAIRELEASATQYQISAQVNLAQGLSAQRQGTNVAAISYYFTQAATLDPSLTEALSRSNIAVANIRTGNIGADVRNDILWRDAWVKNLRETEIFFYNLLNSASPPYTLFYSTGIQQGATNYQARTVEMSIDANMRANSEWFSTMMGSMEKVTQAVYEGLHSTGRASTWGLASWPNTGVTNTNPYNKRWNHDFRVNFEVLNSANRVIGSSNVNLNRTFRIYRSNNNIITEYQRDSFSTVTFNRVSADAITDNLTIRVGSINNATPQRAGIKITALTGAKFNEYRNALRHLRIENGVLRGFTSNYQHNGRLTLPTEVWGDRVDYIRAIGDRAFDNNQLTSISIPHTVTTIGNSAFANNRLTRVELPPGLTSIGDKAFHNNQIYSVIIPPSVKSIGNNAFSTTAQRQVYERYGSGPNDYRTRTVNYEASQLQLITIDAGVRLGTEALGIENNYGRRGAGTYLYVARESYIDDIDLGGSGWWHSPSTNQERARTAIMAKVQQERQEKKTDLDNKLKKRLRSKAFIAGFNHIWGGPSFAMQRYDGELRDTSFWGFELGGYLPFIPYTYIGAETRIGWGSVADKRREQRRVNSEGQEVGGWYSSQTATFFSGAPAFGFVIPFDAGKFFVGGVYEFGTISCKYNDMTLSGSPGFEIGFNIHSTFPGAYLRYRGTYFEKNYASGISMGVGF